MIVFVQTPKAGVVGDGVKLMVQLVGNILKREEISISTSNVKSIANLA
jgi:hypothetical protein